MSKLDQWMLAEQGGLTAIQWTFVLVALVLGTLCGGLLFGL